MPDISPAIPVAGQPNSTEEPKIVTALTQLVAAVNDVDGAQLLPALAIALGVNVGAATRRGLNAPSSAEISTASTTFVTNAADADVSVTQPVAGVTLLILSADGHGGVSPNDAALGVRVDGTTDLDLLRFSGNAYTNGNTILPQNRSGTHTYRLVYRQVNSGSAFFASRQLFVVTLGL